MKHHSASQHLSRRQGMACDINIHSLKWPQCPFAFRVPTIAKKWVWFGTQNLGHFRTFLRYPVKQIFSQSKSLRWNILLRLQLQWHSVALNMHLCIQWSALSFLEWLSTRKTPASVIPVLYKRTKEKQTKMTDFPETFTWSNEKEKC